MKTVSSRAWMSKSVSHQLCDTEKCSLHEQSYIYNRLGLNLTLVENPLSKSLLNQKHITSITFKYCNPILSIVRGPLLTSQHTPIIASNCLCTSVIKNSGIKKIFPYMCCGIFPKFIVFNFLLKATNEPQLKHITLFIATIWILFSVYTASKTWQHEFASFEFPTWKLPVFLSRIHTLWMLSMIVLQTADDKLLIRKILRKIHFTFFNIWNIERIWGTTSK